ncbi:MAG: hypothetical protein PHU81_02280 [Acidobacteriota bacterium]|jgi:hypothetical protein|nr:hypothetical protein [Acidobacteriota bacterium]
MSQSNFEAIWQKVLGHQGETFYTKNGEQFCYWVHGSSIKVSRTNYNLSKSDFATAYDLMPVDGPGAINNKVRGPSYIWAILHDKRISGEG